MQVEVAKEKLPLDRLKEVVNACLQVSGRERRTSKRSEAPERVPGTTTPSLLTPHFLLLTPHSSLLPSHSSLAPRAAPKGPPGRAAPELRPAVVHVEAHGRRDALLGRQRQPTHAGAPPRLAPSPRSLTSFPRPSTYLARLPPGRAAPQLSHIITLTPI